MIIIVAVVVIVAVVKINGSINSKGSSNSSSSSNYKDNRIKLIIKKENEIRITVSAAF